MQVNLVWNFPTTRTDGSPLATADIAGVKISRNGADLTTVTSPTNSFVDMAPLMGSNVYIATVMTTDGMESTPSNSAAVTVVAAPPSAITDLAASLIA